MIAPARKGLLKLDRMNSFRAAAATCILLLVGSNLTESKAINLEKSPPGYANRGARPLTKSPYYGGEQGTFFDDIADFYLNRVSPIVGVRSISISFGDKVDSIQVTYVRAKEDGTRDFQSIFRAPRHGILKSKPTLITLDKHEIIVKVEGQTDGMFVNQLMFTTTGSSSGKKVYGPFGRNGSKCFSFEGYIVAFYGAYGLWHMDRIGVYSIKLLKKSHAFGGTGGNAFDDSTDISGPPRVGVTQIQVWSGETVNAIQVTYSVLGFDSLIANQHGKSGNGNLTTIDFADGELVVALQGMINNDLVSQLTFITRKQDGTKTKYGPFGKVSGHAFSISGKIVAFYGSSGSLIDKIGVYYV